MGIQIRHREVLNNIIRFKDSLLEMDTEEKARLGKERRTYGILLNRRTGDIRFPERIHSLESRFSRGLKGSAADWKETHLVVKAEPGEKIHFEVLDERDQSLKLSDMELIAWEIAHETLQVLNAMAKQAEEILGAQLPEEAVIQDITAIQMEVLPFKPDDQSGWQGGISRWQAEEKLKEKPLGTYLLREADPVAKLTASRLSQASRLPLYPYVLTFVESEGKISDFLVLQTERGWVRYNEEPNLRAPSYQYYTTLQALLFSLRVYVRHPLR